MDDFWLIQPLYKPRAVIVYLAEAIKKVVKVPVITAGKLMDPRLCENIIARGRADIVAFGRVAYADTDFAKKVINNEPQEIRMCIACDYCTSVMVFGLSGARCAINYNLGRMPYEYGLQPAVEPKNIIVVGGGVAGLEAARVAALRKHQVTLFERGTRLGGTVEKLASRIPKLNTKDLANIVEWQKVQLDKLGVKIELETEVTPDLIRRIKPDVVIIATGARPYIPETVPGISHEKVISLDEYLTGEKTCAGNTIVVVGGDNGAEVAYSLAKEGKQVTLIESSSRIARAPYLRARWPLLVDYLNEAKVTILTETELKSVIEQGVTIIDREGNERMIEADTIIIALKRIPDNDLAKELAGEVAQLHLIGDCVTPENIKNAIHSAYYVAKDI